MTRAAAAAADAQKRKQKRAKTMGVAKQPAPLEPARAHGQDPLELQIRDQQGSIIPFKYLKDTPMSTLMDIICSNQGLQSSHVVFTFGEKCIQRHDNAEMMGLKNGDTIDVASISPDDDTQDGESAGKREEAQEDRSQGGDVSLWSYSYWKEPMVDIHP